MLKMGSVWTNEEKMVLQLRSLYRERGYLPYQMSKFEEYDLYARNKHFLVSENVIAFTDTNGKLMALKPDVTLSIIKNTKDVQGEVQKLYYDEHVYRVSKGTHAFGELRQVGLECIGEVDDYCIAEVLLLAAESLAGLAPECVLDVSELGLLGAVTADMGISDAAKAELLRLVSAKNLCGIAELAAREGIGKEELARLVALLTMDGDPDKAIPALRALLPAQGAAIDRLCRVLGVLNGRVPNTRVRLDFSLVSDMHYYNGIVFKGFVRDVPAAVLSGGQYDGLMERMGRRARAVGFAVYLDLLERIGEQTGAYDVDAVLLYDADTDPAVLARAADTCIAEGKRVSVRRSLPKDLKYRELLSIKNGEVSVLEANA